LPKEAKMYIAIMIAAALGLIIGMILLFRTIWGFVILFISLAVLGIMKECVGSSGCVSPEVTPSNLAFSFLWIIIGILALLFILMLIGKTLNRMGTGRLGTIQQEVKKLKKGETLYYPMGGKFKVVTKHEDGTVQYHVGLCDRKPG
jgi:hypothetical protein